MTKYLKLVISKTAKPMGKTNEDWQLYDKEVKEFDNLKDLKAYLKEQYYYVKTKYKTFNDNAEGQQGWIYAFKSDPVRYDDCKHYEQHWINVYKINSKPILVKA